MVFLEHEFGLFSGINGDYILELLVHLNKPITTTFHTILPKPDAVLKQTVQKIADLSAAIIVMTNISANILVHEYNIAKDKIEVIDIKVDEIA